MADVNAMWKGLMLLPLYVISSWLMLCPLTVGCVLFCFKMADVIAMALSFLADVIAIHCQI